MRKLDQNETQCAEPTLFDGGHTVVSLSIEMVFDGGQGSASGVYAIRSINEHSELLAMYGKEVPGLPTSASILRYLQDALAETQLYLLPF